MSNKNFIILIASAVLLILFFIFSIMSNFTNTKKENIFPQISPTSIEITNYPLPPQQSDQYKKSVDTIAITEKPIIDKEAIVGKLLDQLPYQGINFKMKNDYQKAAFIVTIKKDKQTEGDKEFEDFLKKNNIESKDWIRNLEVKYE